VSTLLRGRLMVLGAAICWSTSGALAKLASPPMTAFQVSGYRALFALLFLIVVVKPWRARPFFPRGKIIPLSLVYSAMLVLFICATLQTTAANAIFLQDTAPVWVLILSPWLLKEPFRSRDVAALGLCGAGLCLFFLDDLKPGQAMGNVLALFSGLGYAIVIVGLRWGRPKTAAGSSPAGPSDGEMILIWGNLVCVLFCLPFMAPLPEPIAKPMFAIAIMGVFQLGLGYLLLSKGIAHVSAVEASLLALLEPVLNPIWTYIAVGEKPGAWAMAGGAVIIGTVAFTALRDRREQVVTAETA
jgi:drug/metabolite transporter, DME family